MASRGPVNSGALNNSCDFIFKCRIGESLVKSVQRKPVLYLGDTSLDSAAAYVAGMLSLYELGYDYVPSDAELNGQSLAGRRLFLISDYPSERISEAKQWEIVR